MLTLDEFLEKYFEESGEDDTTVFYDIKDGLQADCKRGKVLVIGVSHDRTYVEIHLEEYGRTPSSEDFVLNNIQVYKVTLDRLY